MKQYAPGATGPVLDNPQQFPHQSSLKSRQVYTVEIPDSDRFGTPEWIHYRLFFKYGLPGKEQTNIFIGRTYKAYGSPTWSL